MAVFSGKNDDPEGNCTFNDLHLIDLGRLEWMRVVTYNDYEIEFPKTSGHSTVIVSNKLIIFGGVNDTNYVGSNMIVLELESTSCPREIYIKRVHNDKNIKIGSPKAKKGGVMFEAEKIILPSI